MNQRKVTLAQQQLHIKKKTMKNFDVFRLIITAINNSEKNDSKKSKKKLENPKKINLLNQEIQYQIYKNETFMATKKSGLRDLNNSFEKIVKNSLISESYIIVSFLNELTLLIGRSFILTQKINEPLHSIPNQFKLVWYGKLNKRKIKSLFFYLLNKNQRLKLGLNAKKLSSPKLYLQNVASSHSSFLFRSFVPQTPTQLCGLKNFKKNYIKSRFGMIRNLMADSDISCYSSTLKILNFIYNKEPQIKKTRLVNLGDKDLKLNLRSSLVLQKKSFFNKNGSLPNSKLLKKNKLQSLTFKQINCSIPIVKNPSCVKSLLKSDLLLKNFFYKEWFLNFLKPLKKSRFSFKNFLFFSRSKSISFSIKKLFLFLYLEPKFILNLEVFLKKMTPLGNLNFLLNSCLTEKADPKRNFSLDSQNQINPLKSVLKKSISAEPLNNKAHSFKILKFNLCIANQITCSLLKTQFLKQYSRSQIVDKPENVLRNLKIVATNQKKFNLIQCKNQPHRLAPIIKTFKKLTPSCATRRKLNRVAPHTLYTKKVYLFFNLKPFFIKNDENSVINQRFANKLFISIKIDLKKFMFCKFGSHSEFLKTKNFFNKALFFLSVCTLHQKTKENREANEIYFLSTNFMNYWITILGALRTEVKFNVSAYASCASSYAHCVANKLKFNIFKKKKIFQKINLKGFNFPFFFILRNFLRKKDKPVFFFVAMKPKRNNQKKLFGVYFFKPEKTLLNFARCSFSKNQSGKNISKEFFYFFSIFPTFNKRFNKKQTGIIKNKEQKKTISKTIFKTISKNIFKNSLVKRFTTQQSFYFNVELIPKVTNFLFLIKNQPYYKIDDYKSRIFWCRNDRLKKSLITKKKFYKKIEDIFYKFDSCPEFLKKIRGEATNKFLLNNLINFSGKIFFNYLLSKVIFNIKNIINKRLQLINPALRMLHGLNKWPLKKKRLFKNSTFYNLKSAQQAGYSAMQSNQRTKKITSLFLKKNYYIFLYKFIKIYLISNYFLLYLKKQYLNRFIGFINKPLTNSNWWVCYIKTNCYAAASTELFTVGQKKNKKKQIDFLTFFKNLVIKNKTNILKNYVKLELFRDFPVENFMILEKFIEHLTICKISNFVAASSCASITVSKINGQLFINLSNKSTNKSRANQININNKDSILKFKNYFPSPSCASSYANSKFYQFPAARAAAAPLAEQNHFKQTKILIKFFNFKQNNFFFLKIKNSTIFYEQNSILKNKTDSAFKKYINKLKTDPNNNVNLFLKQKTSIKFITNHLDLEHFFINFYQLILKIQVKLSQNFFSQVSISHQSKLLIFDSKGNILNKHKNILINILYNKNLIVKRRILLHTIFSLTNNKKKRVAIFYGFYIFQKMVLATVCKKSKIFKKNLVIKKGPSTFYSYKFQKKNSVPEDVGFDEHKKTKQFSANQNFKLQLRKMKMTFLSHRIMIGVANILKEKKNKRKLDFLTLIIPSKKSFNQHKNQRKTIVFKSFGKNQALLIQKLAPIIRKWSNYFKDKIIKNTGTFNPLPSYYRKNKYNLIFKKTYLTTNRQIYEATQVKKINLANDFSLMKNLWKWSLKRHKNKNNSWIKRKYFYSINNNPFLFTKKRQIYVLDIFNKKNRKKHSVPTVLFRPFNITKNNQNKSFAIYFPKPQTNLLNFVPYDISKNQTYQKNHLRAFNSTSQKPFINTSFVSITYHN